jgi:hypothetical protein
MSTRDTLRPNLVAIFVVLILGIAQVVLLLQPFAIPSLSIVQAAYTGGNSIEISYKVTSPGYPLPLRAVAIPLQRSPIQSRIYVVYTGNYQAYDLLHWLQYSLSSMHWSNSISIINESQIYGLLRNGFRGILVLMPGSLTVASSDLKQMSNFASEGGTLIWIDSAPFGGSAGSERQLLGIDIRASSALTCNTENQSSISNALSLQFDTFTGQIVSQSVMGTGGLALGNISRCGDTELTSIAAVDRKSVV